PRSSNVLSLKDEPNGTMEYEHDMIFTLNKKALDYLEDRLYLAKNRDVIFRFHLILTTLGSTIRAGPFRSDSSLVGENKRAVILAPDNNPAESDLDFNILASAHSNKHPDILFLSEVYDKKITIKIPSSDWVNDFQEKLGLGKFMIVEIPQLTVDLKGMDEASLGEDQRELRTRLVRALENSGEINEDIRKADWKKLPNHAELVLNLLLREIYVRL
ncbi:MAG TPA: hypothetical protein VJ695_10670, partial [Nitrososphaera sp.]|nr:hypothetical protein [Nitrososphaera sp.]